MLKWIMPKFLSDLTPQDWFKLAGLAVAGTLLYADVHSSIEQQVEHNARQDKKLVEIQDTLKDALRNQAASNAEVSEKLGEISEKLGVIGESTRQLEKRTERIERKL